MHGVDELITRIPEQRPVKVAIEGFKVQRAFLP